MASESAPWHHLTAVRWREKVAQTSAVDGVRAALRRIEEQDVRLNAFSQVFAEEALQAAEELDQLPKDQRGILHGIPVAIKEELDVSGAVTTFGTHANSTPKQADSEVVARLRRAGAVIIGKTNMPEFGAYPFTSSRGFGVTRNPLDISRTPGGSSGGSGAAVAAGMVPLAMGGDGGGSIRIPAAMCGICGLKPGRAVLPTAPYQDLWKSLGTSGPMARTLEDVELMFSALHAAPAVGSTPGDARGLRIGKWAKPSTPMTRVARENLKTLDQAAEQLELQGAEIIDFGPGREPKLPNPTIPFIILMLAGIRSEIDMLERPERIERKHRLTRLAGGLMSPRLVAWAEMRAQHIGQQVEGFFAAEGLDAVITPTVADRPRRADILHGKGALRASLASIPSIAFTAMWNVSGQPALAIPGTEAQDGLPTSVQLVGRTGSENALLSIGRLLHGESRAELNRQS